MTLFYEGRSARITHKAFEALTPTHQTFSIPELRYVHQLRSSTADAAIGSASAVFCSGTIVLTSGAVAALGATVLHSLFTTLAALLVLIPSSVLLLQSWKVRSRPNALWAVYRGERVCLFQTRDKLVFKQVRRALLRALESAHEARDLAAPESRRPLRA